MNATLDGGNRPTTHLVALFLSGFLEPHTLEEVAGVLFASYLFPWEPEKLARDALTQDWLRIAEGEPLLEARLDRFRADELHPRQQPSQRLSHHLRERGQRRWLNSSGSHAGGSGRLLTTPELACGPRFWRTHTHFRRKSLQK